MIEYIVLYLYKVQYLTYLWHQYNNEDILIFTHKNEELPAYI